MLRLIFCNPIVKDHRMEIVFLEGRDPLSTGFYNLYNILIFQFLFFVLRLFCLRCEYVFLGMDVHYSTSTASVPSHLSFSSTYKGS